MFKHKDSSLYKEANEFGVSPESLSFPKINMV